MLEVQARGLMGTDLQLLLEAVSSLQEVKRFRRVKGISGTLVPGQQGTESQTKA